MCMIRGRLAEVKIRGVTEWWFSTSQNGGFRPGHSHRRATLLGLQPLQELPPSAVAPLERVRLFSDPRSSVFIRGKLLGFNSLQISVISVYQWSVFVLSATIRVHPR